jgi:hypothetical protein
MAALLKDRFPRWLGRLSWKRKTHRETQVARDFANRVYKQTGGPTAKAKQLYAALLENERRSAR